MAYGDGGFFFTQPVGNGYSGLGSMQASRDNLFAKGLGPGSSPLIAPVISMTRVLPSGQSSSDLPDLTMIDPMGPGPMPMLSAEQAAEMGLLAPDEDVMYETVSAETEEPEGLMGFFQKNMLVSAAVIGAVAFFGYRYAKRQGMIA